MLRHEVQNPSDALNYLVNCQLATVCEVVGKRSSAKCVIDRHILIAQTGVNWLREYGIDLKGNRAADVVNQFNGNVAEWAQQFKA